MTAPKMPAPFPLLAEPLAARLSNRFDKRFPGPAQHFQPQFCETQGPGSLDKHPLHSQNIYVSKNGFLKN